MRIVERAALVATGDGLLGIGAHTFDRLLPAMLQVLERKSYPKDLPKHIATYWNFIEATQGDRAALRALALAEYPPVSPAAAAAIKVPTLVISGSNDAVLGQGAQLAGAFAQGSYQEIAGADHFSLAMDPRVQTAVADFLGAVVI
jgi:pimeloyl-ACP methyl ester carboxylesterase